MTALEKATTTPGAETGIKVEEHISSSETTGAAKRPERGSIEHLRALIAAMRPRQWTKNFAVFIGIVFAQELIIFHAPTLELNILACSRAVLAFITFCFASSSIYLLNDLLDLEKDQQHPIKCKRPLASGRLPISWAIIAMGALVLLCATLIAVLFMLPLPRGQNLFASLGGANVLFALVIASYLVLMVLYSTHLKHVVLVDVFIIASGFVLRILAGAIAIPVNISPWLYLVTIFLSLFLALSKRRHELVLLQGQASSHRQILKEYSIPMLDQMITIAVGATIMSYSLYTIQGQTGHHRLMITVPLVLYGIFRYLYLVYMKMEGGSPEEVLLRDPHMLGTVLLCTTLIITVLYILPQ
jgi:4-hydroxybenzoate polyprenyltransferase